MILLSVSGDVETNPGPTDDIYLEKLAELIAAAPTDIVKDMLGRWRPDIEVGPILDKNHHQISEWSTC